MDINEVFRKFDEIVETDDKNVASQKIVDFKEYITQEAGADVANDNAKSDKIGELEDRVKTLESENSEIRKANTDILLKYGAMAQKIAENVGDYVPPPKDDKPKSWSEIASMD